ncbi:MAG: hypothetical protein KDK10_04870 [Maritimibacter sp.]|nr:hypothetical protein [Maritimibacter sp.]
MLRTALLLIALATPVRAEAPACPADAHAQIEAATRGAEAGKTSVDELAPLATQLVRACRGERALLGHLLAMFTRAGLAAEPPARFAAHQNAYKTATAIIKSGARPFDDLRYGVDGAEATFSQLDERNAYWDLMFALASDFLVFGVGEPLYAPGTTETFGCGLYPAEEAAALAALGEGNADGGELVIRLGFLGRSCDEAGETAGQAARYFAAHLAARAADPEYLGLTEADIRSGLQRFLPAHLAGAAESPLFDADEVARLLAF